MLLYDGCIGTIEMSPIKKNISLLTALIFKVKYRKRNCNCLVEIFEVGSLNHIIQMPEKGNVKAKNLVGLL